MVRTNPRPYDTYHRSPHPRGDGPLEDGGFPTILPFSPPTWGWSDFPAIERAPLQVLPTHVGMVRASGGGVDSVNCSPHPRGDGPVRGISALERARPRWTSEAGDSLSPGPRSSPRSKVGPSPALGSAGRGGCPRGWRTGDGSARWSRPRCGSRPGRARAWQAAAALQRVVADPGQSGATSASRSAASGRTRRGRGARDKNAAPAGQARRGGRAARPIRTSRSIRCRRPWGRPACRRRSRC